MLKRLPLVFFPVTLILLVLLGPLLLAALKSPGGFSQSLRSDTVTTTGKVISVGPSAVGAGSSVVTYTYDAPGFPRNGNAGSFTREQAVAPGDLARFKPQMQVPVEYSHAIPGSSRLKGYGTGNVYLYEMLHDTTLFVMLLALIGFGMLSLLRGASASSKQKALLLLLTIGTAFYGAPPSPLMAQSSWITPKPNAGATKKASGENPALHPPCKSKPKTGASLPISRAKTQLSRGFAAAER